jgi:hypothetical protein
MEGVVMLVPDHDLLETKGPTAEEGMRGHLRLIGEVSMLRRQPVKVLGCCENRQKNAVGQMSKGGSMLWRGAHKS